MTATDIATVLDEYRVAAANAMASGFDGVEIHAANGYLPHQFLSSGLNLRTDAYGGSVAKRARLSTRCRRKRRPGGAPRAHRRAAAQTTAPARLHQSTDPNTPDGQSRSRRTR